MLTLRIENKRVLAEGIVQLVLADPAGGELPGFTAGAHIDVHLANGLSRQYSLCNTPSQSRRYVLGVQLAPDSRGGSRQIHALEAGALVQVGEPRNLFPLVTPPGSPSVLIAAGIGITPMLSMAHALHEQGAAFELHYCVRSRARLAFLDELNQAPFADRLRLYIDDEAGPRFAADALAATMPPDAHLYVCGPAPFMDGVFDAARGNGVAESRLHREHFSAPERPCAGDAAPDQPFVVRLAHSGETVAVGADESVAKALARAGFDIPIACEQGVCGTCRTRVVAGTPDHRDICLDDDERASNAWFTPCCSRACSPELVIEL